MGGAGELEVGGRGSWVVEGAAEEVVEGFEEVGIGRPPWESWNSFTLARRRFILI